MKNTLRLSVFLLCTVILPVHAQEETESKPVSKGKTLIGAYFNFSVSSIDKVRPSFVNTNSQVIKSGITLTGGRMISDRWGLLMIAGYANSESNTPVTFNGNSYVFRDQQTSYTLAPAARYYGTVSEGTYVFIQGTAILTKGTSLNDEVSGGGINTVSLNTSGYGFAISPGISYFMSKKLTTEISIGVLGYSVIRGEDSSGNKTETRTFQSLLYLNSVSLGFVFYL